MNKMNEVVELIKLEEEETIGRRTVTLTELQKRIQLLFQENSKWKVRLAL